MDIKTTIMVDNRIKFNIDLLEDTYANSFINILDLSTGNSTELLVLLFFIKGTPRYLIPINDTYQIYKGKIQSHSFTFNGKNILKFISTNISKEVNEAAKNHKNNVSFYKLDISTNRQLINVILKDLNNILNTRLNRKLKLCTLFNCVLKE